jgi:hypothetical protein
MPGNMVMKTNVKTAGYYKINAWGRTGDASKPTANQTQIRRGIITNTIL